MGKIWTWLKKFGWLILLGLAIVFGYALLMRSDEVTYWTMGIRKKLFEIDKDEDAKKLENERVWRSEVSKLKIEIEEKGTQEDKRIAEKIEAEYQGKPDKICKALNRIVEKRITGK